MNLLPSWARKSKARKSLIKNLALIQTAIFLLLFAGIFLLKFHEKNVRNQHSELLIKLSAFDSAPSELARELQSARAQADYIYHILDEVIPPAFDVTSLEHIKSATPESATLVRINYENEEITVISRANNLNIAEIHRENLSQYFTYVNMGNINNTDDAFTYEIKIPTNR